MGQQDSAMGCNSVRSLVATQQMKCQYRSTHRTHCRKNSEVQVSDCCHIQIASDTDNAPSGTLPDECEVWAHPLVQVGTKRPIIQANDQQSIGICGASTGDTLHDRTRSCSAHEVPDQPARKKKKRPRVQRTVIDTGDTFGDLR